MKYPETVTGTIKFIKKRLKVFSIKMRLKLKVTLFGTTLSDSISRQELSIYIINLSKLFYVLRLLTNFLALNNPSSFITPVTTALQLVHIYAKT